MPATTPILISKSLKFSDGFLSIKKIIRKNAIPNTTKKKLKRSQKGNWLLFISTELGLKIKSKIDEYNLYESKTILNVKI